MKLTAKEKRAVAILRRLDSGQRDHFIRAMRAAAQANEVIMRAGAIKRLQPIAESYREKAFGVPPAWKYQGSALVRVREASRPPRARRHAR